MKDTQEPHIEAEIPVPWSDRAAKIRFMTKFSIVAIISGVIVMYFIYLHT